MEFYKEHSTEEMAEILGRMSKGGENLTPEELKEISDGLYWLEAAAENPYNSDYFRTLFRALDNICNYDYLEELAEEKVMNEGNGENLRVCAHCLMGIESHEGKQRTSEK